MRDCVWGTWGAFIAHELYTSSGQERAGNMTSRPHTNITERSRKSDRTMDGGPGGALRSGEIVSHIGMWRMASRVGSSWEKSAEDQRSKRQRQKAYNLPRYMDPETPLTGNHQGRGNNTREDLAPCLCKEGYVAAPGTLDTLQQQRVGARVEHGAGRECIIHAEEAIARPCTRTRSHQQVLRSRYGPLIPETRHFCARLVVAASRT